mgnify:CR=1 FL=1
MQIRSGTLLTVLGSFLLLAIIAGYFLFLAPDGKGPSVGKVRDGAPSAPWLDDTDSSPDSQGGSSNGRDSTGPLDPEAAAAEEEARRKAAEAAAAEGTKPAEEIALAAINPDEINAPVPGYLIIRVLDKADDRPLPGTTVYFPIRGEKLATERGDVSIDQKLDAYMRRTNRHGVAVWSQKELAQMVADQKAADPTQQRTSVLITALGYADLFEPMTIPDLSKGAEATYRIVNAVRITGKVRARRGGAVEYAKVDVLQTTAQGDTATPSNRFSFEADGLGEFTIKLAETYLYTFEVKMPGYATYTSRVFNFREDKREVTILLEAAKGISGTVTNDRGEPIEGAEVWARDDGQRVTTDATGKFAFDMVRDRIFRNDVSLRVTAEGYAPAEYKALANDHAIVIALDPQGTLHGIVLSDRNEPVVGAVVQCTYLEGNARYPYDDTRTDEKGVFTFKGFAAGRVLLHAFQGDLHSDTATIDVAPKTNAGPVKLVLRSGAGIAGRVHSGGLGIANVTIALDGKAAAATDGEGNFTLGGLADGKHKVRIVNQFPISDEQLRQLPVFTTDGKAYYYLPAEREVTLKLADQQVLDFDVQAFDAKIDRKITVRVTTTPNTPAQAVQVTLKPVLGSPPPGVEQPKTQVVNIDLPDGKADMPLSLLDGVSYEATFFHNRFFEAKLAPDALNAVKDGEVIEVVLERAFVLKGYVQDGTGAGIEGAGLSKEKNNPWNMQATTDIYGYFEFGQLKAGEYTITAFKTSYYQEQVVVTIENTDPETLNLKLVGANEIRIIVTNGGTPQPGAHLHIYRNDSEGESPDDYKRHFDIGTTDANGEKYINFHWVRNYQIVGYHGTEVCFANFNNMRDVPEREFTIELEPSYELRGTMLDADTQLPLAGVVVRAHIAPTGVDGRDGNFFQLETDANGQFNFRVPAGDYWFYVPRTASHQAYTTQPNPVPAGATGLTLEVPIRTDIEGNYAQILSLTAPNTVEAGQQFTVEVTVRNKGNTTWTSAGNKPWRLGSQSPRDNKTWGMGRVSIAEGQTVGPGDTYTFSFTATAPTSAGTYDMQWQMVQDGVQWFGQLSQKKQIIVTAPPPQANGG